MPAEAPGELTAVDIAVLDDGAVAQVVVNEQTECLARLHATAGGPAGGRSPMASGTCRSHRTPASASPQR